MKISNLPIDAPYNEGQRAWLNGFFSGMQAHMSQSAGASSSTDSRVVTILYGSQTGSAESVAIDAGAIAKTYGLTPSVKSMDEVDASALAGFEYLLIVTSTYGEGEMPDNAQMLWDGVEAEGMPSLASVKYSVLALGDTSDTLRVTGIGNHLGAVPIHFRGHQIFLKTASKPVGLSVARRHRHPRLYA